MKLSEVKKGPVGDVLATYLQLIEAIRDGDRPAKFDRRGLSNEALEQAVKTGVQLYNENATYLGANSLGMLSKAEYLHKAMGQALKNDPIFKPYADAVTAIAEGGKALENYGRVCDEIKWRFWSCAKDRQRGKLSDEAEIALKLLGVQVRREL